MPSPNATTTQIHRFLGSDYTSNTRTQWGFEERFIKRPLLLADMDPSTINQAAVRLLTAANTNWSVSGTNMTSALSTNASGGGLTLTTAGASADQAMLSPGVVNTNVSTSGIGGTTGAAGTAPWLTAKSLRFRTMISLSSIASVRVVLGYKLTATPTIATDDDQVLFQFDTAATIADRWQMVTSVGGTDTQTACPSTIADYTPVINTNYFMEIKLATNGAPSFYINGRLMGTGPAMTATMALIPFFGVQALASGAKAISIRSLRLARLY